MPPAPPPAPSRARAAAGACALLAVAACGTEAPAERAVGPVDSLVLLTVDTLRPDLLGGYGGPAATPRLDGLATESVVFERAYSQATLTHPALTSILTGVVPPRHGVHTQNNRMAYATLPLQVLLRERGFATGSFVANLCKLQAEEDTIFSAGWDERGCGMDDELDQYLWDTAVVDAAIAWLQAQRGPFFCWVHLMDPHAEHRPPPDLWDWEADPPLEKFAQYRHMNQWEERREMPPDAERDRLWALYEAEIEGTDREIGRLLDALDAHPQRDRTALVFTSDHGEELYETWSRYDHGFSLSEGVLWVPLFVRAPGLAPDRSDAVVETLQVMPTALRLLGLEPPYRLDGPSLLAQAPSRGFALSFSSKVTVTLRSEDHRYWFRTLREPWTRAEDEAPWRADAPWFRFRKSLADYPGAEPRPRTNVRWLPLKQPEHRQLAGVLHRRLQGFLETMGEVPKTRYIRSEEVLQQLGDLGYTGEEEDEGDARFAEDAE